MECLTLEQVLLFSPDLQGCLHPQNPVLLHLLRVHPQLEVQVHDVWILIVILPKSRVSVEELSTEQVGLWACLGPGLS